MTQLACSKSQHNRSKNLGQKRVSAMKSNCFIKTGERASISSSRARFLGNSWSNSISLRLWNCFASHQTRRIGSFRASVSVVLDREMLVFWRVMRSSDNLWSASLFQHLRTVKARHVPFFSMYSTMKLHQSLAKCPSLSGRSSQATSAGPGPGWSGGTVASWLGSPTCPGTSRTRGTESGMEKSSSLEAPASQLGTRGAPKTANVGRFRAMPAGREAAVLTRGPAAAFTATWAHTRSYSATTCLMSSWNAVGAEASPSAHSMHLSLKREGAQGA
mmetsp:Transcript_116773/g.371612  ORF Transcript_116773/g.371612 Transcript_116773/m.371612 type:complete len:274 (-) Transcript_116773:29-850(-)